MFFRSIAIFVVAFLFVAINANAQFDQQDVTPASLSDDEIIEFVDIYIKQSEIEQQAQMQMISAIEEEGLSLDRFQEIIQATQMGGEADATESELEKFQNCMAEITEIEQEMIGKVEEMIVAEGMTMERYEEIFTIINSDPETMQKVQEVLMQRMQEAEG